MEAYYVPTASVFLLIYRPTSRNMARVLVLLIAVAHLEHDCQESGAYPGALIDPVIDIGNVNLTSHEKTLIRKGRDGRPSVIPTCTSCHVHCCATKGFLCALCQCGKGAHTESHAKQSK
eukprot:645747-Ditylum_brightwellii.AAC.1